MRNLRANKECQNTAKVSFIIPTKDRPDLLQQALASCLAQTNRNWEAVVVDDHSREDPEPIVLQFNDERIRFYKQVPAVHGVAKAREYAVGLAESQILITLDSDDISSPERVERCITLLDPDEAALIYTRVCFFNDETGSTRDKAILEKHNLELLKRFNYITNAGTAFTKKAYMAAGGYYDQTLQIGEDYELYLRMACNGVRFVCIDERHVYYRKGHQSVMCSSEEKIRDSIRRIRKKHNIQLDDLSTTLSLMSPELRMQTLQDEASQRIWC
jgi:glycosyltransferase involved in cell wall biosynthesis